MSQLKKVMSNTNKKFIEEHFNKYQCSICNTPVQVQISPGATTGYKYKLYCPTCDIVLKSTFSFDKDQLFGRALRDGYIKHIDN